MACSDMEKLSLDVDPYCDSDLSGCAAAMEKERESYLSPTENPSTISVSASIPPDQQGYDVEFDPPLESKYECPICLMGLRSAVQTPCGHRFCNSCIKKSIRLVTLSVLVTFKIHPVLNPAVSYSKLMLLRLNCQHLWKKSCIRSYICFLSFFRLWYMCLLFGNLY